MTLKRNDVFTDAGRHLRVVLPFFLFSIVQPISGGSFRFVCTYGLERDELLTAAARVLREDRNSR